MTINQESWIEHFQEHGYVAMERVFSEEEVQRMRQEADAILELILNSSNSLQRQSGRLDPFKIQKATWSARSSRSTTFPCISQSL